MPWRFIEGPDDLLPVWQTRATEEMSDVQRVRRTGNLFRDVETDLPEMPTVSATPFRNAAIPAGGGLWHLRRAGSLLPQALLKYFPVSVLAVLSARYPDGDGVCEVEEYTAGRAAQPKSRLGMFQPLHISDPSGDIVEWFPGVSSDQVTRVLEHAESSRTRRTRGCPAF